MKKSLLLLFLLILVYIKSYGFVAPLDTNRAANIFVSLSTIEEYSPTQIPPSPNAASLGKYGEIPVNYSAGAANVGIPLYTANEGAITWPISIDYNYAGFRPADETSSIGFGWALKAGGVITRTTKGRHPDEKEVLDGAYGFLKGNTSSNGHTAGALIDAVIDNNNASYSCSNDLLNNTCQSLEFSTIGEIMKGKLDSESDVFNFSVGSISGQFFFNHDGQIKIVSDQNLKITYTLVPLSLNKFYIEGGMYTNIINWTIIDEQGTKYKFGFADQNAVYPTNVEFFVRNYKNYTDANSIALFSKYISAWHLYEVESVEGLKIQFTYTNDFMNQQGPKSVLKSRISRSREQNAYEIKNKPGNPNYIESSTDITPAIISNENTECYLKSITGTNWLIDFFYTERTKLNTGDNRTSYYKLLDSIEVKYKSNVNSYTSYKKFLFTRNFTFTPELLISLREKGSLGTLQKPYVFEYHNFPSNVDGLSLDIDFWNFYNYDNTKGINQYLFPFSLQTTLGALPASNRTPKFESTIMGALKKLTYPTGGFNEFFYEQNDFAFIRSESHTSTLTKIGGIRIQKIIENPIIGNAITKEFVYRNFENSNQSSGVVQELTTPYAYGFDGVFFSVGVSAFFSSFKFDLAKYDVKVYKSEPFYNQSINPVYYFNVREKTIGNGYINRSFTSHFDWDDFLGVGLTMYPDKYGPVTSKAIIRSLPKKVEYFNENNELMKAKIFEYKLVDRFKSPNLHSELQISSATLGYFYNFKSYLKYSGWVQKIKEIETTKFGSQSVVETTEFGYDADNSNKLQVRNIGKKNSMNKLEVSTFKYPYDFSTPVYSGMTTANFINPKIEEINTIDGFQMSLKRINYGLFNGFYAPSSIQNQFKSTDDLVDKMIFNSYDNLSKFPSRTTEVNGIVTDYSYFEASDFGKTGMLKSSSILNNGNNMTTTYDYFPLIGVKSITSPNLLVNSYLYDEFGRLSKLKTNNDTVKEYKYNP